MIAAVALVVVLVAGAAAAVVATRDGTTRADPTAPTTAPAPALAGPERVLVTLASPSALRFSPDGRRAYQLNSDTGSLVVLDATTRATVAAVPIGPPGLNELAVSSDGRRVYVPRTGFDDSPGTSMAVVDAATNTVVASVPLPPRPSGVAVSPDGRRVFVSAQGTAAAPGNTVAVIDAATNAVVRTVTVGDVPIRLAVSPDGQRVYAADYGAGTAPGGISAFDVATGTTLPMPAVAPGPNDVVVAPDGRVFLSAVGPENGSGSVQLLDPAAGTVTDVPVAGPRSPHDVAVSPDGRTLVVSYYGTDQAPERTVAVLDATTLTLRRLMPFAGRPWSSAVTPDSREAWVSTTGPDELWRIPLP